MYRYKKYWSRKASNKKRPRPRRKKERILSMKKCLAILAILAIGLTLPSCSKDNGQTPTLETEGTTTQGTSGTTSPSGRACGYHGYYGEHLLFRIGYHRFHKTDLKDGLYLQKYNDGSITSPTASATETPTEPSAAPPAGDGARTEDERVGDRGFQYGIRPHHRPAGGNFGGQQRPICQRIPAAVS